MGVTKTFCYCTGSFGYCKPQELAADILAESGHWSDIERNCLAYLNEPVCVPNMFDDARIPVEVAQALEAYLRGLLRVILTANAPAPDARTYLDVARECTAACITVLSLASEIDSGLLAESPPLRSVPSIDSPDLDAVSGRVLQLGHVLTHACARACNELFSAKHQGLDDYIAHHFILIVDMAHEMHVLALGAMRAISTENLLHEDQTHTVLAGEK